MRAVLFAGLLVVLGACVAQGGSALPAGVLTQEEAASLLFMREEEKLARDVYLTLGGLYPIPVFQNIAQSEVQHMAAVA